jgi:ubiquinone/menaquinone biosynthesis C-methylase UbiE
MDRRAWLDAQRESVEETYDRLYSPTYDEDDSPITPTHRRFVENVIESCPRGGRILDAPCGTGRFFEMVQAAGRTVVGIDQSAGMLARARAKHPDVVLGKVGLQALEFDGAFDAAMWSTRWSTSVRRTGLGFSQGCIGPSGAAVSST